MPGSIKNLSKKNHQTWSKLLVRNFWNSEGYINSEIILFDEELQQTQTLENRYLELKPNQKLDLIIILVKKSQPKKEYNLNLKLSKKACLNLFLINFSNSKLNINCDLEGKDSHFNFEMFSFLEGDIDFDLDIKTNLKANQTSTNQNLKIFSQKKAKQDIKNLIFINPGLYSICTSQNIKGYLLSKEAKIKIKPELKIQSVDVECSHGLSVSSIEESWRDYFASRGLNFDEIVKLFLEIQFKNTIKQIKPLCLQEYLWQKLESTRIF